MRRSLALPMQSNTAPSHAETGARLCDEARWIAVGVTTNACVAAAFLATRKPTTSLRLVAKEPHDSVGRRGDCCFERAQKLTMGGKK